MAKRICWKKGMRLTDDILRASDNCMVELVNISLKLAAAGRFGLLPSTSFELSLNISNRRVDVELLHCTAVTRGGDFIDVHYDTRYKNSFDTRVQIPEDSNENEYILTVFRTDDAWKETNDGYEEPVYSFSLIAPNSPVPSNAFPVARIVDEYGWRLDDLDFVPPCLFISSHQKYIQLQKQFSEILSAIDTRLRGHLHSNGREAIRIFWPIVQQLRITIDKECDTMTPMGLLANVQKCVSIFICACELDEYLELADAEKFKEYVSAPYNYKNSYNRIKEGLELCFLINDKIEKFSESVSAPAKLEAPTIPDSQLSKRCTNSKTRITINNNVPGATVYYTIDGAEPTEKSRSGQTIQLDSGFNNSRKREPDRVFIIKVKAFLNGMESATNTYEITLQKDIERWTGIEI